MKHLIFLPISSQWKRLFAFDELKRALAKPSFGAIRHGVPFSVETDAPDYALAAISSQDVRAYMSRILTARERCYPAVEKEAPATIEAVRPWSHFLREDVLLWSRAKKLYRSCSIRVIEEK